MLLRGVEEARSGFMGEERERIEGRDTVGDSGNLGVGEVGLLPINTS